MNQAEEGETEPDLPGGPTAKSGAKKRRKSTRADFLGECDGWVDRKSVLQQYITRKRDLTESELRHRVTSAFKTANGRFDATPLGEADLDKITRAVRELPDMMSALEGEGGHVKAETVEEVARILYYKSALNADKGEGVK